MDPLRDVMLTSHMGIGAYELDFALGLGVSEAVRLTHLVEYEGLIYLMPATLSGDVAVAMCVRDDDLACLKADKLLARYGQHVG